MDTNNIGGYDEIKEDGELKLFYSNTYEKFGISNKNKNKSTKAFYDRIVTSQDYVFVKSGTQWGILDRDLSVILPMVFKEIIPVILTDFSSCLHDDDPECLDNFCDRKPYIVIQSEFDQKRSRYHTNYIIDDDDENDTEASIFEIIQSYEDAKSSDFVVNLDNDY